MKNHLYILLTIGSVRYKTEGTVRLVILKLVLDKIDKDNTSIQLAHIFLLPICVTLTLLQVNR